MSLDENASADERRLPPARKRVRLLVAAGEPGQPKIDDRPRTAAEPERGFEVGYGKPPKHTQFKPGNQANPRGRPKGSKNFTTILSEELSAKVPVRVGGKTVTIDIRRAMAKTAIAKAMNGDFKAIIALAKLDAAGSAQEEQRAQKPAPEKLSPEIERLMDRFLSGLEADAEKEAGQ